MTKALLNDIYNLFANLTHYPSYQFVNIQSLFPRLQAATTNHLENPLPDICFFKSACPFICLLGKSKYEINNTQATNILIALNTLNVIIHCLKDINLSDDDKGDIVSFLIAIKEVIETVKDIVNPEKSKIFDLLEDIERIKDLIEKNPKEKSLLKTLLSTASYETQSLTKFIRSGFRSTIQNSCFDGLIPYLMQLSLDYQTYGLFAMVENQYAELELSESLFIKAAQFIFERNKEKAILLLRTISEKFSKLQKSEQIYISDFFKLSAKSIFDSTHNIIKKLDEVNFSDNAQSLFTYEDKNLMPFELSELVINIINLISNGQNNNEMEKQFKDTIISKITESDSALKYLCKSHDKSKESLGYISLIGSLLNFTTDENIKHFTGLINTIQQTFINIETIAKNKIQDIDIPLTIVEEYSNVDEIAGIREALHSFVVYIAIISSVKEKNENTKELSKLLNTMSYLIYSWILSISKGLQSIIVSFVPNVIKSIEKNISIKQEQIEIIHNSYKAISAFSFDIISPNVIRKFTEYVSKCMSGILPLINNLMTESPISLAYSENDLTEILGYGKIALNLFLELQGTIEKIVFSSQLYLRQQVRYIAGSIQNELNKLVKTKVEQSQIFEICFNKMPYIFGLSICDPDFDVSLSNIFETLCKVQECDDKNIQNCLDKINNMLDIVLQQTSTVDVTLSMLDQIDINSEQDINNLINAISNQILKESSKQFIEILKLFKDESMQIRNQYSTQILGVLASRVNRYQQYDLSKLLTLSDDELTKMSISIFASLPLNAPTYSKEIQQIALPLVFQKDIYQMHQALSDTYNFLTLTIKIRESCHKFLKLLHNKDSDVNSKIFELVQSLDLNVFLSKNKNNHTRSIYDIAKLYAVSNKRHFSEKMLESYANEIFMSNDIAEIELYTHSLILDYISTSIANNSFKNDVLLYIKDAILSLESFKKNPTKDKKRELYSACLMFTTDNTVRGNISSKWCIVLAYSMSYIDGFKEDALEYIDIIEPNHEYKTFEDFFNMVPLYDDSMKKNKNQEPIIVKRVIKKVRKPDPVIVHKVVKRIVKNKPVVNHSSANMKINTKSGNLMVRFIEISRNIYYTFEKLNTIIKTTGKIDNSLLDEFISSSKEILSILEKLQGIGVPKVPKIYSILSNIIEHVPESKDKNDELLEILKDISKETIKIPINYYGIVNPIQSELIIVLSEMNEVMDKIKTTKYKINDKNKIFNMIKDESLSLLSLTKEICEESVFQISYILFSGGTLLEEKSLLNAVLQTSEASQMINILLSVLDDNDNEIQYKICATLEELRSSITNVIINLSSNNMSKQINSRIEKVSSELFKKIQKMLDAVEEAYPNISSIKQPTMNENKELSLVFQKRNAAANLIKKNRALEEAEEDIKRLNRSLGARSRYS